MAKNKRRLKPKVKIVGLAVLTVILAAFTFYAMTNYSLKKVAESLTYNAKGTFNHTVCYLENDDFEEECFSDNRGFVNALIDIIDVDYSYTLKLSRSAEILKYKIRITTETVANEKNNENRVLYTNTEVLYEDSGEMYDTSLILIDKDLRIDFKKYNDFITNFKKNYVLSVDSNLIIRAELEVYGNHSHLDAPITNKRKAEIIVPLAEQTVNIETEGTSFSDGDKIVKLARVPLYSKDAIISLSVYIFDVALLGMWLYVFFTYNSFNRTFDGKINRLLKQYDRAIVKVENIPDLSDMKIVKVASFEELLDVRDNLNKPILYRGKNLSAKFLIINEPEVFLYEVGAYDQSQR